ncbi:MAG: S8 family serine peptidase [Sphingomonadaceae bacterium]
MTPFSLDPGANPAPGNAPGKSPERFQVIVRLAEGASAPGVIGQGQLASGRLEKLLLPDNAALGGGGVLHVFSFPETPAKDAIITALGNRPGVEAVELDSVVTASLASSDGVYTSGQLWGMNSAAGLVPGAPANEFGSHADAAWASAQVSADGRVGAMTTVIGVIDSGVDVVHPDLYLNIWVNQGEIPAGLASDQDGDGIITFRDLNAKDGGGNYIAAVSDINGNGYIDADDILSDPAWENGIDEDGNGFMDDLFGWDFYNNDNRPFEAYTGTSDPLVDEEPSDSYHGTHVAGTIGATANGYGVAGVVWDVQLMPLRFLGPDGSGFTSDAIAAINYYAMQGLAHPGLDFIATNNSWGGGGENSFLANAIEDAGDLGHLFVAAAGNDTEDNDALGHWPSNYQLSSTYQGVTFDPVISVASIDSNGAISGFSNFGATSVDLGAPGGGIASTLAGPEYFGEYAFVFLGGTSMATPHVTGAIALASSENPGTHPADIRAALLARTTPTTSLAGVTVTGGRLDVSALVDLGKPGVTITLADTELTAGDTSTTITFAFSEAVTGFEVSDITITGNHGDISGLSSADNQTFTATFLPSNVETTAAQVSVGEGSYSDLAGNAGVGGASAAFSIDRLAPGTLVLSVAADEGASGVDVTGTLDSELAPDERLEVYRDGAYLGDATVTGTSWSFTDTDSLADGFYDYTARPVDQAGNNGTESAPVTYQVLQVLDFSLTLGTPETGSYGNVFNGTSDADGRVVASFTGTDEELSLSLTGWDITWYGEVKVFLNGAQVGTLLKTEVLTTGPTEILIAPEDQQPGVNTLAFISSRPVQPWGITDILLARTSAPDFILTEGTAETGFWGNQFNGAADVDGTVSAAFAGTSEDLILTVTGFDVTWYGEVKVYLNGAQLGTMLKSSAGGTAPSQFTIPAADQLPGDNLIEFTAKYAHQPWGITDVLLESVNATDFTLTPGTTETGYYGNQFNGAADLDGTVSAEFAGTGGDLVLSVTGYDVTWYGEVKVYLNGAQIGTMLRSPELGTAPSEFLIPAADQLPGDNLLEFTAKFAHQPWGVTDILIDVPGVA